MKIHKAGYKTIFIISIVALILILSAFYFTGLHIILKVVLVLLAAYLLFTVLYFFRNPIRNHIPDNKIIYVPADGKICAIEKVKEKQYFNDERLKISVYMDITNVHVNRVPVSGTVKWKYHQDGLNYPAYNPKSSLMNERCYTVIKTPEGDEIMVVQIAGLIARRVINNAEINDNLKQGDELGIIKFGSRVDVYLPTDAKPEVEINQKVKAMKDIIASLN